MATTAMAYARIGVLVRASWDTNPSPKPLHIPKRPKPARLPTPPTTTARTAVLERDEKLPSSPLLISRRDHPEIEKSDEQYLGYERWWLPVAPKVKKPRSIYNAASLAYLGDCIYELYARRHFLYPPLSINEYNERVMKVVRCEAQDILLKKILDDDYLTEEERDILRWGKNVVTSKSRTTKRAGVAVYNRASSLETLVGYLYLTDVKRLEELMFRLGFSTGASSDTIAEELCMNFRKTSKSSSSQKPTMQ
ncbi:mini-ribonuclease 3 [Cocos nucifera]|uniref:Mini-ribonuclease 3 n=1 Tax=Cocos nucifera TaxID=13894 RepID=A0A8K0I4I0_COCNU|nr:mini-ribonuclease 3 [Cocos nucifera]